jgi:hypothetical protein
VRSGLWGFVKNNGTISDLFGQIAYSVDGPEITYHMNPKKATVSMKLMVPDITSLGDNDLLPIGSDHEALLLQKAFEWFANQRPPGLRIDPSTDTQFLQK